MLSRPPRVDVIVGNVDILRGREQRRRYGEWAGWGGGLTNTHAGHGSVCATKGRKNAVGVSEVRTWQRAPAARPKSSRGGEISLNLRCREAPLGAPGPLVRRPEQRRSSQPRPCRLSPVSEGPGAQLLFAQACKFAKAAQGLGEGCARGGSDCKAMIIAALFDGAARAGRAGRNRGSRGIEGIGRQCARMEQGRRRCRENN